MKRTWAVVQVDATTTVEDNLRSVLGHVEEAARAGCSTIALPEFFLLRGDPQTLRSETFDLDGEAVGALKTAARRHDVYLLGGTLPFPDPAREDRIYNTAVCIDPDGEVTATYRKMHLFDVEFEDGFSVHESEYQSAGENVVSTRIDGVRTGLSICYDLRFPELYRNLVREGCRVLFVPSNFTRETGRAHWEPLLRARAIENQAWVVAPNQIGTNPETGVAALGQSMVVDPWGQVVARASDQPGWVSVRLDFEYLEAVRRRLPALEHVRMTMDHEPV